MKPLLGPLLMGIVGCGGPVAAQTTPAKVP